MMEREPIEDHRHVSLGDTQEPWDDADSLPLTDEELAGLRPLREANPGLVDSLRLMRESMEATMEVVSLKLDKDVMAALRSEGPGWERRANAALRRTLGLRTTPAPSAPARP